MVCDQVDHAQIQGSLEVSVNVSVALLLVRHSTDTFQARTPQHRRRDDLPQQLGLCLSRLTRFRSWQRRRIPADEKLC